MLLKYRPEDKAQKKERLLKRAQAEAEGKTLETKKPIVVKYGLNHVTYLIEQVFFFWLFSYLHLSVFLAIVEPDCFETFVSSLAEQSSIGGHRP